jgi:TolC family type I secretion outer membrane protein
MQFNLPGNKSIHRARPSFVWLFLILIVYFLFFPLPVHAEAIKKATKDNGLALENCAHPLSLTQLTNIALNNNPATRIAWEQVKIAAANLGIVKSSYWPQINTNINLTYGLNNAFKRGNNNSGSNQKNNLSSNPALSINYLLLDFGTRANNVNAAHDKLLAEKFSSNADIQQLILQLNQAYYHLLGQQAMVIVAKQTVNEAQTSLASANALHKAGMAIIGDVYQAQSTLAQAELSLQKVQEQLAVAKGQLAITMGLPVQTSVCVVQLSQHEAIKPVLQSVIQLVEQAKKLRPDLLAAQAQVKAAQATLVATKAQAWPTLQLTANTGQTCPTGVLCNYGYQSSVTLSLNIPLFTGFSETNAIRRAEAQQEQTQAQHTLLANQISLQVWQAYYALQGAYQAIHSTQVLLKSSVLAAEQALGQYRAGVGNILSVLTTQTAKANAKAQLIQAQLDWYLATAQLAQALGTLNTVSYGN